MVSSYSTLIIVEICSKMGIVNRRHRNPIKSEQKRTEAKEKQDRTETFSKIDSIQFSVFFRVCPENHAFSKSQSLTYLTFYK
jgi:hypothetical protein